jgi:hypothetical protein
MEAEVELGSLSPMILLAFRQGPRDGAQAQAVEVLRHFGPRPQEVINQYFKFLLF